MEWSCPYCGSTQGLLFEDGNLKGILCQNPDCGRVDPLPEAEDEDSPQLYDSDL